MKNELEEIWFLRISGTPRLFWKLDTNVIRQTYMSNKVDKNLLTFKNDTISPPVAKNDTNHGPRRQSSGTTAVSTGQARAPDRTRTRHGGKVVGV